MNGKRWMRIGLVIVVVLLLLSAGGYAALGTYIYGTISNVRALCGTTDDMQNTPADFTYTDRDIDPTPYHMPAYEDVTFAARGEPNVQISAWFVPAEQENAPAVIVVHGLNSCKRSEHSLTAAGMLHRAGFNVLLLDLRNMGESMVVDGRFAAGIKEYADVLGGWDYLVNERGFAPEQIGLFGQSLGAATVLIAMGEEPRVAAVWEDSSFADMNETIQAELPRFNIPIEFSASAVLMGQVVGGVDITSRSPLMAMNNLNGRPLFITHGDADERLSVQFAYDLAEAARANGTPVEPWILPGLGHTQAIFEVIDEYEARLVEFFRATLPG